VTATTLVAASVENPGGNNRVAGSPSSIDAELSTAAAAFDSTT
jgi:hypothetical protein